MPDENTPETTVVAPVVGIDVDPAIGEFVAAIEAVGAHVADLLRELTDAQINWRPSEGRWSIAECIEHLSVTGTLYVGAIADAVQRGEHRGLFGGRDFHPNALGRWVIAQMEPPPRRRFPAPRRIVPQRIETGREVLTDFETMHRALIDAAQRARGLDLERVRMRSPVVPLVRLPLGTWLGFLAAHERRHLWQARQVRQELRFPGA
jgi:hypothetical protein